MSDLKAILSSGKREDTVIISPHSNGTLRSIERSLNKAGVYTVRHTGCLHFSIDDLFKVQAALSDWQLYMDSKIESASASLLNQFIVLERGKQLVEEISSPGVAEYLLQDFPERSYLDHHQISAVATATHPEVKGLCLFDEQGLGKTVTTLFSFHRLRQTNIITSMLVIAPKNMTLEWVNDTERFFGSHYKVQPAIGNQREKSRSLGRQADIYVTNFETVVRLSDSLRQLIKAQGGRVLLVVDESFFVKNATARRTQGVRELRKLVQRCLVLCGTPAPNSPHDIVEQFNIADGGLAFRGVNIPDERSAARSIIQQVINERGVYLRRLKQNVLPELPGKTFHQVFVPLQPEQLRAYTLALKGFIRDLCGTDDISFKKQMASFRAKHVALLQICSNPASVIEEYSETPAKLLAMDKILDELITQRREKVVSWSFFTASLNAIMERYQHFNPVRLDGTVSSSIDRREAVRRFQEDDETMLFVANPAAAGAGLTLHRACFAIYESMSNQAAHYFQSLDRIHRRGQIRAVEYIVLLCKDTLEIQEYNRLLNKEQAAQGLLGDEIEPPLTRQTMLDDAISAARLLGLMKV